MALQLLTTEVLRSPGDVDALACEPAAERLQGVTYNHLLGGLGAGAAHLVHARLEDHSRIHLDTHT